MSDSEMQELFIKNLKRILNEKHCLSSELAEGIGVRKSTVSNWMNGLSLPRMDKINRICGFLNVNRSELFEDPTKNTEQDKKEKKSDDYYLSDKRKALDKKIDQFNDDGIQKMSDYADDIIKIPEYRKENTSHQTSALNAAHERTDIEVTEEMKKHDDDIMNDDSEWN